ncbi:M50 family metallopeptidase [Alicyclobacillus vulcanalis]|uniref:Regulator of sigma E protease n=1 Tax=Alicyclobacillus vulcanalis TaxID=252246 RepID=A0A1N7MVQ6_9BACL|nr:M50 family metallopeptidase [Alicyclobacillus vulcanalis]SIS90098.1 regulator of sigma E protease [Alicyclobacillus vulcanalis]
MPILAHLEFYAEAAVAIVLVFGVCVTLHEFGHFYVAKRCGVAVPVFAIGFGPKIASVVRGGTEYSLRLIPLGGFVQLAGEAPQESWFPIGQSVAFELDADGAIAALGEPRDLPGARVGVVRDVDLTDAMTMALETDAGLERFRVKDGARVMLSRRSSIPVVTKDRQMIGKPLWQRAAIILAGPIMNLILAGVLFSAVNTYTGVPTTTVGHVEPGTPAAHAGLVPGDTILSVDGRAIHSWAGLVNAVSQEGARNGHVEPLVLEVQSREGERTVVVTPHLVSGQPMIGIDAEISHNPLHTVPAGFSALIRDIAMTIQGYVGLFVHHQFQTLSGPVGIAHVITEQVRFGIWNVVAVTGALSLGLGLFNLLPIPALDGGRLLFMAIELVRGRRVDPEKEGFVHFVGFAIVMLFAVVITYRDVTHWF